MMKAESELSYSKKKVQTYEPVLEGPGATLERVLEATVTIPFYGRVDQGLDIQERLEKLIRLHFGKEARVIHIETPVPDEIKGAK